MAGEARKIHVIVPKLIGTFAGLQLILQDPPTAELEGSPTKAALWHILEAIAAMGRFAASRLQTELDHGHPMEQAPLFRSPASIAFSRRQFEQVLDLLRSHVAGRELVDEPEVNWPSTIKAFVHNEGGASVDDVEAAYPDCAVDALRAFRALIHTGEISREEGSDRCLADSPHLKLDVARMLTFDPSLGSIAGPDSEVKPIPFEVAFDDGEVDDPPEFEAGEEE